jgi:tetrathionate reductase subunit B
VDACPYNAIYFNEDMNLAQKCTGCAHLLDRGWKEPRCADVCPTKAIKFGEESELTTLINSAEELHPEVDIKPRLHYLNIPGKFIAGTVYDPINEEVIIGATCSLVDKVSGKDFVTSTDSFGDFWFHDLGESTFSLRIESNDKTKVISVNTEKDVNLGDIPLT